MSIKKRKLGMAAVLILLITVISVFFVMGRYSARQQPLSLSKELEFSCGGTPNCVTSNNVQLPKQKIEPLNLSGLENAEQSLLEAVRATGGKVVANEGGWIAATYKSSLFGFVDDVAIKVDKSGQLADVISRSRVGHSDFGANRKRIEAIRAALKN